MKVLVDSSVWIDYFKEGKLSYSLDFLLSENLVCTNEIILAELVPFINFSGYKQLAKLLSAIEILPLNIDWKSVTKLQEECLKNGINSVGISDLLIFQQLVQQKVMFFSFDKHFKLMGNFEQIDFWHY